MSVPAIAGNSRNTLVEGGPCWEISRQRDASSIQESSLYFDGNVTAHSPWHRLFLSPRGRCMVNHGTCIARRDKQLGRTGAAIAIASDYQMPHDLTAFASRALCRGDGSSTGSSICQTHSRHIPQGDRRYYLRKSFFRSKCFASSK